ncbi:MAG: arginase [Saprospiraceae bacterium]|nr:MAG: arginase [Saprospiraceae bacterium]
MFENWLRPIDKKDFKENTYKSYQLGKHLIKYQDKFPELEPSGIAFIGIDALIARDIRKSLYSLSNFFPGALPVDLGDVRKTGISFLIPLFKELLENKIVPVLLGAEPHHILALYKSFREMVSLAIVDERIPLGNSEASLEENYLEEIISAKRSRLFHLGLIGYQVHFASPLVMEKIEANNFESVRLGKGKAEPNELEPIIRDADLLNFHLRSLKQSETPDLVSSPSGFTVEEACQISRYAGMSDKMRAFSLTGFQPVETSIPYTAQVAAQIIWYFMDGFYSRKQDFPVSTEGLVEYIVDFQQDQIVFWKSKRSGRWWIQVPVKTRKKYDRHRLIPCSYNDYRLACQEELPDRLLNAFRRFL